MNVYFLIGCVYILLLLVGTVLSILISVLKCGKTSSTISFQEGISWGLLPAALFALVKLSPYVSGIFSNPIKNYFTSLTSDSAEIIGAGYLMMLGSWVMTTRMIHSTETAVCKPSKDELQKFAADLEKELKEKEDSKQANINTTS